MTWYGAAYSSSQDGLIFPFSKAWLVDAGALEDKVAGAYYTLASWHVRKGNEEEFVRLWKEELADAFLQASPAATGTLIQSLEDPLLFYSFGPWPNLEVMQQARTDPAVGRAIKTLMELCDEAKPAPFRVVLTIP